MSMPLAIVSFDGEVAMTFTMTLDGAVDQRYDRERIEQGFDVATKIASDSPRRKFIRQVVPEALQEQFSTLSFADRQPGNNSQTVRVDG